MQYQISFSCPLGFLSIKSNSDSINEISFSKGRLQEQITCGILERCKSQLQNYFEGKLFDFDLPLSPRGTDFQQKVWNELLKIPYGETITYMELAVRVGDARAVRAVGTANGKNPVAILIPCHRVIGAGNKLIGYSGGIERKKFLLNLEQKFNPHKQTLF
jgi:methylated-DNA-[protein]-cysteine S-methyltransferase